MKFLADHCFFSCGISFLQGQGYDVIKSSDVFLQRSPDEDVIAFSKREGRILLTLDTDFANLSRFPIGSHPGIILFRINPFAPGPLLASLKTLTQRKLLSHSARALMIVYHDKIKIIRPGDGIDDSQTKPWSPDLLIS